MERLNLICKSLPACLRPAGRGFAQAGLRLPEASRLSFDRPLPGKPPNIPDVSSVLSGICSIVVTHSLAGEGWGEGGLNS